jgi:hypothetical protein
VHVQNSTNLLNFDIKGTLAKVLELMKKSV